MIQQEIVLASKIELKPISESTEGQTNKTHFMENSGLKFTLNTEVYKLWILSLNHN
jgi:hypothetical protein